MCFRPDGPGGRPQAFIELEAAAVVIKLTTDVPVAALEDVIASKEAAGREKDRAAVGALRDLLHRRRLEEREDSGERA